MKDLNTFKATQGTYVSTKLINGNISILLARIKEFLRAVEVSAN